MNIVTIALGVLLVALGVGSYIGTGSAHPTALIPAYAGALFIVLGALASKDSLRKHAMHAAAMLGVLGFLGAVNGIPGAIALLIGGTVERPAAALSKTAMSILCAIFVALCVRSFVMARRARTTNIKNA